MNISPKLRPRVSFIPIILNALNSPNPDTVTKRFKSKLGPQLVKQLTDNWKRMPGREKNKRYFLSRALRRRLPVGDLATQLAIQSKTFLAAREQMIRERKNLIKAEVDRAIMQGIGNYAPSRAISKDKALAYEIAKKINAKLFGCRCEQAGQAEQPPSQPPKKFGLKVTKLKCYDQRETGHDEIYLVSAVVDGNGKLVTTTSNKYSINDDDDDIVYPNYWIYPMQDTKGFLDVAVSMWEDDGGYEKAGQTVAAIGGAIGTIPNPYTISAGIALTIIGEVISLTSWLDDDDHYGDAYKSWPSKSSLEAGVGSFVLSYYEVDEGWLDDGHDFDLTLNLISS